MDIKTEQLAKTAETEEAGTSGRGENRVEDREKET